jgi:hypothetical protein
VLTFEALNFLGGEAVEFMSLLYVGLLQILSLVVTEPAVEELLALLALLHAASSIVRASVFHPLTLLTLQ